MNNRTGFSSTRSWILSRVWSGVSWRKSSSKEDMRLLVGETISEEILLLMLFFSPRVIGVKAETCNTQREASTVTIDMNFIVMISLLMS